MSTDETRAKRIVRLGMQAAIYVGLFTIAIYLMIDYAGVAPGLVILGAVCGIGVALTLASLEVFTWSSGRSLKKLLDRRSSDDVANEVALERFLRALESMPPSRQARVLANIAPGGSSRGRGRRAAIARQRDRLEDPTKRLSEKVRDLLVEAREGDDDRR